MAKTDDNPFPPHWLEKFDETELERLAIITMDGGVPDGLAEKHMDEERLKNAKKTA